jgi:hypothetical protein
MICENNICLHEDNGPAPIDGLTCMQDEDCLDETLCPSDAPLGCVCVVSDKDSYCANICTEDTHCFQDGDVAHECGLEGHCVAITQPEPSGDGNGGSGGDPDGSPDGSSGGGD